MFCSSTKWLVDNWLTELVENWKCLSFAYHLLITVSQKITLFSIIVNWIFAS